MFVKIRVYFITNLFNTSLIFTSKVYQIYINCISAYQLVPYGKPKFFPSEVCEYWEDRWLCLLHPHSVKSVQIRNFFLISIFPHSECISSYLFVFSPNTGKNEPEETYLDTFHTVPKCQTNMSQRGKVKAL